MFFSIVRILVGLFFLFGGAVKLLDLQSFRDAVVMFDVLPKQFINIATVTIPSAELICGLALLLNSFKRASLSILTFLVAVFITAIAVNLLKGRTFECGCLGFLNITDNISWFSVLFDGGILTVIVLLFIREPSTFSYFEQVKFISTVIVIGAIIINIPFSNKNHINFLLGKNIVEIDLKETVKMISDNNTLLIDARYSDLYNKEHIPSAISLPFNKFFDVYKQYKISDRNKNLIIYCNNALCNQARYVAYEFIKKGMNNVYVLEGGFQQWKSQELKKY